MSIAMCMTNAISADSRLLTDQTGRDGRWAPPLATVALRMARTVSGPMRTKHSAVASRRVSGLPDTSTIRAAPVSSRWVSPGGVSHTPIVARPARRGYRTSGSTLLASSRLKSAMET